MPAPGHQHQQPVTGEVHGNPFEEERPRISAYSAQEIATLQRRLDQQLGPEWLSSRAGPSGGKVHYIAAEKCIQLANEIFGFNGWSSRVLGTTLDFVDENATTLRISLGLSVVVRVTLRDGTSHEDVGYGHVENAKGKAAAFEKAKKQGTTDALKRALRCFGSVLGNCIYDKDYLAKVTRIKAQPAKWDEARLYRNGGPAAAAAAIAAPPIKREPDLHRPEDRSQGRDESGESEALQEDEFGDFDDADFSVDDPDAHPDEVVLPPSRPAASSHSSSRGSNGQPMPERPPGARSDPQSQAMAAPPRPHVAVQAAGRGGGALPQTPNGNGSWSSAAHPPSRPNADIPPHSRAGTNNGTGIARHSVPGQRPPAPGMPGTVNPQHGLLEIADVGMPAKGEGFSSARAASSILQARGDEPITALPPTLPPFDPHHESPIMKRGNSVVNHQRSGPVSRGSLQQQAAGGSGQAGGTGIASAGPGALARASGGGVGNHPLLDGPRRIGAPGSPSPMANRNQYRPPTMKRPMEQVVTNAVVAAQSRAPLSDLSSNGMVATATVVVGHDGGGGGGGGGGASGGDVKRQKLDG